MYIIIYISKNDISIFAEEIVKGIVKGNFAKENTKEILLRSRKAKKCLPKKRQRKVKENAKHILLKKMEGN